MHRAYKEGYVPFVVFGLALSLESVDLVHVVCLMVASVQEHAMGTKPLIGIQEEGDFC